MSAPSISRPISRLSLAHQLLARAQPCGPPPRAVVAIPARDEAARIEPCLSALLRQRARAGTTEGTDDTDFGIVVLANNCRDATAARAQSRLEAAGIAHLTLSLDLPPAGRNAGFARGLALDVASLWVERGGQPGILLTTDADTRVGPDWVGRNRAGLGGACGAVAGRFAFDDGETRAWPLHLRRRRQIECAYEEVLAALSARLDPRPHDPWPNHWTESGASFALTLAAYRRIGGLPAVTVGEDRALAAALARHDIDIRHDPDIVVTTSARLSGRAHGGCASTLLRRASADLPGDERLEALPAALRRMILRGQLRASFADGFEPAAWERRLCLHAGTLAGRARRFGEAWSIALAASPLLVPQPLRPAAMERHLRAARDVTAALDRASAQGQQVEAVIRRALLDQRSERIPQRRDELVGSGVA